MLYLYTGCARVWAWESGVLINQVAQYGVSSTVNIPGPRKDGKPGGTMSFPSFALKPVA